ncbi:MAG: NADH-quinone oxidoreductase subunit C [Proteobacteria bacterium]|nr:NADH-quinone oxidoreductase subunit C [Pseudomonadota bacterium]
MHSKLLALKEFILKSSCKEHIQEAVLAHNELTLIVTTSAIKKVALFLRDNSKCRFQILVCVCGADYPERENRFDVVYNFLSLSHNQRIRVKVQTDAETAVPTLCEVYSSAGWYERETFDMYGVTFSKHEDMRRILTDYNFEGYPLRKDFPLTGYVEVRYDVAQEKVVYEPVQLQQAFRNFDAVSPWEGIDYVLPGDEKAS